MNISKLLFLIGILSICNVFAMEEDFRAHNILKRSEKIINNNKLIGGLLSIVLPNTTALHFWSKKGKFQSNVNFETYEIIVQDDETGAKKTHYIIDSRPQPKISKFPADDQENKLSIATPIINFENESAISLRKIELEDKKNLLYEKEEILKTKENYLKTREIELNEKEADLKVQASKVFDKLKQVPINQNENIKQRSLYYPYILGISGFLIGGVSAYYGHARIDSLIAGIANLFRKN